MPAEDRRLQRQDDRLPSIRQVVEVSQSLTALQESPEVLRETLLRIAETAMEVLEADLVDLYQYRADRDEFVLPPITVGERRFPHLVPKQILPDDVVVKIAHTGERMYAADAQKHPVLTGEWEISRENMPEQRFVVREEVASSAGIPLQIGEEVVGVLFVNYRQRRDFDDELRYGCEAFASQAAIALQNARLFQRERQRADAMDLLQQVSATISAALDLEETLALIIKGAMQLTGTDSGVIHLVDEAKEAVIRSYEVPEDFGHLPSRFSEKEGMTWTAVNTGEIIAVSDITKDERVNPAMADKGVWAIIGTPLKVEERTIGVLFLNDSKPHEFTDYEKGLLSTLASQAAIAIRNTNLLAQERRRADALDLLQEVSATISAATDVEESLDLIVQGALQLTKTDAGVIHLIDETKQAISHSHELPTEFGHLPSRFSKKKGLTWDVFCTGQVVEVLDVPKSKRVSRKLAQSDVKSVIGIPLKLGGSVIGVLFLNSFEQRDFTADEKVLLTMLAEQAALAIDTARRYEQRVQDISALEEINEAILEKGLDDVTQLIAERAMALTEATYATLRLVDESGKSLMLEAVKGRGSKEEALPIDENSFTGWTATTGEAALCPDVKDDPHYVEWYPDVKSCMAAPLKHEDQVIGTLYVEGTQVGAFSEQYQLNLLAALANQAAIAIQNAQLLGELEEGTTRLVRLQDVTAAISAMPTGRGEVLRLIAHRLGDIFQEASCVIRLYDSEKDAFGEWVAAGVPEDQVGYAPRPDGTSRYIVKTKAPRYIEDTSIAPPDGGPPVRKEIVKQGVRAAAHLPLIGEKEDVIGVLYVNLTKPHRFSEDDQRILGLFADQAAIAIENARLYERLEASRKQLDYLANRKVKALQAVNKVGQTLTSGINLNEEQILDLIYEQATPLMDTSDMYIALYEPDPEQPGEYNPDKPEQSVIHGTVRFGLAMDNGRRVDTEHEKGWGPRKADEKPGLTEYVIRTRKAHRPADVKKAYDTYATEHIGKIPKSWMGVPMLVESEVLGVVVLRSDERENVYDEDDLEVLQAIASQSAVALQNARLVHQLEQRVEELNALQELAEQLSTGALPDVI